VVLKTANGKLGNTTGFLKGRVQCFSMQVVGLGPQYICQGTSTRRQQSDLCGLRVKLPPVTTSLEAIKLSTLPKDTTSELASLSPQFRKMK